MDTSHSKTFLPSKEAYINTVAYYKEIQKKDPEKISDLVSRLQSGERIPLPCTEDPDLDTCDLPPTPYTKEKHTPYFSTISDILKDCGDRRYMIFFSKPPGSKIYLFLLWWVSNIVVAGSGNIKDILLATDSTSDPTPLDFDRFIQQYSIKTVQC